MWEKRLLWWTVVIVLFLLLFMKYTMGETCNEISIRPEAVPVECADTEKDTEGIMEEYYMTAVRVYGTFTVLSAGILLIANRKKEY